MPFITPKLSDTQAGFRKGRGCRDNVFILVTTIQHLQSAETEAQSRGIITYIDFMAAFDSILHSYLFNALKQYGVPPKYYRLVQCVYKSAKARVRLQEPGGNRSYSRSREIRRGVIQGDIPSPICFLVSLDKLLKDHGSLHQGVKLTDLLHLSDLEYADDAAFPDESAELATNRLTILDAKAKDEAGMEISIPKTKAQHICKRPKVTCTTEDDIVNLPPEKQFKYKCEKCSMTYPTQHGLSVHKGRWCKKRKTKRKPSRKGTVADRVVQRMKIEEYHAAMDKVNIGTEQLENVYTFTYLCAEIASDGDPEVSVKHRTDIAWGRFSDYHKTLMAAKLPVDMRTRLYKSLVVSTMVYGAEAWLFTRKMQQKLPPAPTPKCSFSSRSAQSTKKREHQPLISWITS